MSSKAFAAGILVLALVPSAWLAWTYRDMPHLGYFHDDGIYWASAKSLAEGGGYRIASLPGQPFQTKYPPLFPLVLSLVWRFNPSFPGHLPWATLLVWLSLPVAVWMLWRLVREMGLPPAACVGVAAAFAVNPYVVLSGASLMTELPFCCLLFASLLMAERAGRPDTPAWCAAAAGVAAGGAYLVRNAALPLLITAPLCLLLRRQRIRGTLYFCAMLPAVAGWTLWSAAHAVSSQNPVLVYYTSYSGYHFLNVTWPDVPMLLWKNLDALLSSVGGLLIFDLPGSAWGTHLSRVLAAASIAGAVRLALARRSLQYASFSAAAIALLLVWHYPPNERLLLPVFPLLLAGFWTEVSRFCALLRSAWIRGGAERAVALAASGGLALVVCSAAAVTFRTNYATLPGILDQNRRLVRDNLEAYRWIEGNVPEAATVLAYRDPVLYLYTGRRAYRLPPAPMPFYRQDREGILRPFRTLSDLAKSNPYDFVLQTAADLRRFSTSILAAQREREEAGPSREGPGEAAETGGDHDGERESHEAVG